jgi:hypothetical protein
MGEDYADELFEAAILILIMFDLLCTVFIIEFG